MTLNVSPHLIVVENLEIIFPIFFKLQPLSFDQQNKNQTGLIFVFEKQYFLKQEEKTLGIYIRLIFEYFFNFKRQGTQLGQCSTTDQRRRLTVQYTTHHHESAQRNVYLNAMAGLYCQLMANWPAMVKSCHACGACGLPSVFRPIRPMPKLTFLKGKHVKQF